MTQRKLPSWIQDHLRRYRETDGEDGHMWDATLGGGQGLCPTLLLTTIGRKTGKRLELPLIYGRHGDAYVIVASKGGHKAHPIWYLNLAANPEVEIQVKAERMRARARTAIGEERAELWQRMVELYGPYADYQARTDREIPVVVLDPIV
jgi:proline iminopeptidase